MDEFSDDECKYVVSSIKVGNSESGPYKDVLLTEQSVRHGIGLQIYDVYLSQN